MIMDCINVLERNKKSDVEMLFFENYLIGYVPYINDPTHQKTNDAIILNKEDQRYFKKLHEFSTNSKNITEELSFDKNILDAFAWCLSTNLIVIEDGAFLIDKNKLLEKIDEFNKYQKYKQDSIGEEAGISYTKKI